MGEAPDEELSGTVQEKRLPLSTPKADPELHFEEQMSKLITENDDLKRERTELQRQLDAFEERVARLQDNNVGQSSFTYLIYGSEY